MKLNQRIKWLFNRKLIIFFQWEKRFLNPLIIKDMKRLECSKIIKDRVILDILNEYLPKFEKILPPGMYFPVPICRSIKNGEEFTPELAQSFHYNFIKIDKDQRWSLHDKSITGKVLKLFKSNLFFEKETNLFFVEYWSDNRWDKCYLECETTPMLVINFFNHKKKLMIKLNNQQIDNVDLHSFRIDKNERCFVKSKKFGEAMLADAPRFWLLDNLDKNFSNLIFDGKLFSLSFRD